MIVLTTTNPKALAAIIRFAQEQGEQQLGVDLVHLLQCATMGMTEPG